MSRERVWRAELVETLPDGTQHWRIIKRRRILKDYKRTFMELYNQGLNDTEIGDVLRFTPPAISNFRRNLELPSHIKRMKDYKSCFMKLYDKGISDREIGKTLGFSRQTIGEFRRSLDLPVHFTFFGVASLGDEEKKRIRESHGKGLPIKMIAKEIGWSNKAVHDFCKEENLDTSRVRGRGYKKRRSREILVSYLEEHGPTLQSTLFTEVGISKVRFSRIAREMFDQIERFGFKVGKRKGGTRHAGYSAYDDLNFKKIGYIFALRDDPRIVDFVAETINIKVGSPNDARTLVKHLKEQMGTERAKDVVRKLGYVYTKDRRSTRAKSRKKFTDEEFLALYEEDLNDREVAEKLGVTTSAVNYRRCSMKLPINATKRGRPHKEGGSKDTIKKRKQWREASATYYKKKIGKTSYISRSARPN